MVTHVRHHCDPGHKIDWLGAASRGRKAYEGESERAEESNVGSNPGLDGVVLVPVRPPLSSDPGVFAEVSDFL